MSAPALELVDADDPADRLRERRLRNGTWPDAQDVPPLQWAIPGLIPEGMGGLLTGPPKAGKSWAALVIGLAVSAGGIAWVRVTEGLADADQGLDVTRACVMPDGSPFVLGWEEGTSTWAPQGTAWRRTAGAWSQVAVPNAAEGGRFTSCAATPDGLLLRRSSDGPDALWRTVDGTSFEHVFAVQPGDEMLDVRAVPGGLAASARSTPRTTSARSCGCRATGWTGTGSRCLQAP